MGFGAFYRRAVFLEPVMVWSLTLWATSLTVACVAPSLKPYMTEEKPKQPLALKEVIAGIQEKLEKK